MTSINEKPGRTNIRIEIKNDISDDICEPMDIDTTAEISAIEAEIEDGEISDCKENDDVEEQSDILSKNRTIILNKNEVSYYHKLYEILAKNTGISNWHIRLPL